MASLLAHAAIPWITRRAIEPRARGLTLAAVLLAVWPDVDLATVAWEVRPNETWGHRGATHSLVVASLLSLTVYALFFRSSGWRALVLLLGASMSHGLLDAATPGGGVALFAPFTNTRYSFPFKLIPACPMGFNEYLGFFGFLTFANEVLFVVLPLAIVVSLWVNPARRLRTAAVGAAALAMAITLRVTWPAFFAPRMPRPLTLARGMTDIPHDDLPAHTLVTRLEDLKALGLFDRDLRPANAVWSSSFFPMWFGGEAGRSIDGSVRLVWRTLFGFPAPTAEWARDASDDARFRMSPTEKVDLALGHLDFPATHDALKLSHDADHLPRYWYGRCSGVTTAAINGPEPFRVVDVTAKDGTHVRFHPQDIKALLALAYYTPTAFDIIGEECASVSLDPGAACSMNPALLVVALTNRVGIARQSLAVDVVASPANQYYPLASARVRLVGREHAPVGHVDPSLGPVLASVIDVAIDLVLSATTLPYERANVPDPADPTGRTYMHVGVVSVPFHYTAVLGLSNDGTLVGGRWTGEPPDGPDDVVVVAPFPKLDAAGMLATNAHVPWTLVKALADASADPSGPATLDLR